MLKYSLFIGASLFASICHAQYVNEKYLHGEWKLGNDSLYTILNFINDSIVIESPANQPPLVVPYELALSKDGFSILITKPKDGGSILSVHSRIVKISNDEMNMQTLNIRHFDRSTRKWIDLPMPADSGFTFRRMKK
jgi:hypothetical protein